MPIIRTEFPHAIREIEHTWIPLRDGARLAARLWLPVDAEQRPIPALLEYIPYRKNDHTWRGDVLRHPYFAGHGYASIRVDIRGSGESEGILLDEYLKQEQDDALEVLEWIAAQPWCTGALGMIGYSWGGFAGLQIAARRPPQLKAIITHCSTDDRYLDDCHYMGGCLLASDMLKWASYMFAYTAQPPDPRHVGERWRAMWLERMEKSPPAVEAWLTHQRRDAYWKHGSVSEDYGAIECAVFATGGWADSYTNAIPRLLEHLTCPRKGLIGPWAHRYPEIGVPGPAIGFLQEALRWWDYWLKGIDTGIMDEPMLRVWMQDSPTPSTHYDTWPGRWAAEPQWPSPNIASLLYALDDGRLATANSLSAQLMLRSDAVRVLTALPLASETLRVSPVPIVGAQSTGLEAGVWCPYGSPGDMPGDQRHDDARSLCFDSAQLAEGMETLGFPEVTLSLSVDRPLALIAVRLCDVAPQSGAGESSLLVSWGLLNLTHRDSHEQLQRLEPGRRYTVTLKLNAIGHCLPAGHRWRLAVSPTYWPHTWPSPEPVTLTVFGGELSLPVRRPRPEDSALREFGTAEIAAPLAVETLSETPRERYARYDLTGQGRCEIVDHGGEETVRLPNGIEYGADGADTYSITEGDPLSARARCQRTITFARADWRVRIETDSHMWSDATHFHVTNKLEAYEGDEPVFNKTRAFSVLRDLV
ncbi:MAG: CocE/NonD family hydrolase [Anaerolineales bacterium]